MFQYTKNFNFFQSLIKKNLSSLIFLKNTFYLYKLFLNNIYVINSYLNRHIPFNCQFIKVNFIKTKLIICFYM